MSLNASYFIFSAEKEERKSIDPENPDAVGLIHFYQELDQNGDKKWKFLSAADYEAKKSELPNICFATHHPMASFLDRVSREKAGNASEEDRSNSDLPNLLDITSSLAFDKEAQNHSQKTTNTDAVLAAKEPLYYAYHRVNDEEIKVVASELEALAGGCPWDMNPTIFYRVKEPVADLTSFPLIELNKLFKQSEETNSLQFTIKRENIDKKDIDAVEITDQKTLERTRQVLNFTADQDLEIIR